MPSDESLELLQRLTLLEEQENVFADVCHYYIPNFSLFITHVQQ